MPWENNMSAKINNKEEFSLLKYNFPIEENINEQISLGCSSSKKAQFFLQPQQHLIQMLLSDQYPYRGLILFHGVGTGKTCTSIQVAET